MKHTQSLRRMLLATVLTVSVLSKLAAVSMLFGISSYSSAQNAGQLPAPPAVVRPGVVSLTCNPFYLPARSIWPRTVDISLDGDSVRSIEIDGVAVYTFNVNGTVILTAVDGERIQIDMAALTWSSDLRGIVSGRGSCT